MPFYEYECSSCKFYTEVLQKVSDPPLRKCPSCGKSTMKKLVSAPNFRLKGGGWYETDFKSDKENKRNLAVEKEPEAKAPDDKKSADAKPDAKPVETKTGDSKPAAEKASSGSGSSRISVSTARSKTSAKSRPRAKPAPKRRKRR
jgi:putative FmdB family regulatory protein